MSYHALFSCLFGDSRIEVKLDDKYFKRKEDAREYLRYMTIDYSIKYSGTEYFSVTASIHNSDKEIEDD